MKYFLQCVLPILWNPLDHLMLHMILVVWPPMEDVCIALVETTERPLGVFSCIYLPLHL